MAVRRTVVKTRRKKQKSGGVKSLTKAQKSLLAQGRRQAVAAKKTTRRKTRRRRKPGFSGGRMSGLPEILKTGLIGGGAMVASALAQNYIPGVSTFATGSRLNQAAVDVGMAMAVFFIGKRMKNRVLMVTVPSALAIKAGYGLVTNFTSSGLSGFVGPGNFQSPTRQLGAYRPPAPSYVRAPANTFGVETVM